MAEKAAGALLDHVVRAEDLSIVGSHDGTVSETSTSAYGATTTRPISDGDNDLKNAGDAGVGYAASAGDKIAEAGDRTMGAVSGMVGDRSAQANWDAAADRKDANAASYAAAGNAQMNDAVDANVIGSPTYSASTEAERDLPRDSDTVDSSGDTEGQAKHGISTTTGADAGAGAIKGAGWGLGVGALAALASVFIPGFGLVLGGGALAAALSGVAATTAAGAASGAVTGYLKDQGVDHEIATTYENTISSGGAILAVSLPSGNCDREEALQVLSKYGASNVNAYEARANDAYVS